MKPDKISISPILKRKCSCCDADNLKEKEFYKFNLDVKLCQECWDYYKNNEPFSELSLENISEKEATIDSYRQNIEGRIVGKIRKNKARLNLEKSKTILAIVFGLGIWSLIYVAEEFIPIFMYGILFCVLAILLVQFVDFIYTTEYNGKQEKLNNKNRRSLTSGEIAILKEIQNVRLHKPINRDFLYYKRRDNYIKIKHNQLELISQKIDEELVRGKIIKVQSKKIKWTEESGVFEVSEPTPLNNSQSDYSNNILVSNTKKNRKRKSIPINVKDQVWNRDKGMCVNCGSNEKIEFDHIIPHSKGGTDTYRNLQLLCEKCNRKKGAKII